MSASARQVAGDGRGVILPAPFYLSSCSDPRHARDRRPRSRLHDLGCWPTGALAFPPRWSCGGDGVISAVLGRSSAPVALPLTIIPFVLASLASAPAWSRWLSGSGRPDSTARRGTWRSLRVGARLDARARCSMPKATPKLRAFAGVAPRARGEPPDVPGVLLFRIDGLRRRAWLRDAIRDGHVARRSPAGWPMARIPASWECDLSSRPGPSAGCCSQQLGIRVSLVREGDRPHDGIQPPPPTTRRDRAAPVAGTSACLARGPPSRGNMCLRHAPRCTATISLIRDRLRSKAGDLFAYFSDPTGFIRTIVLAVRRHLPRASRGPASSAAAARSRVDGKRIYAL